MEDMISRNDAYNTLTEYYHHTTEIQHKALREALERVPNSQPELIEREAYIRGFEQGKTQGRLDALSAQPEPCEDTISRQAAMEEISKQQTYKMFEGEDTLYLDANDVGSVLASLPSAHPEKRTEERTETHTCDYINRKDAIDAHYEYCNKHPNASFPVWSLKILEDLPPTQSDLSGYSDKLWKAAYERGKAEAQQRWIPCSERLPEHRLYVLITYKYEYGLIDNGITWYSETENKWNTSREVIAWMPLPEPYREGES